MTIQRWDVPRRVIDETAQAFARGHHEVFVFWTAALGDQSEACSICRCVVPAQRPGATPDGVYVHIAGAELSRVQFDNFDRGERSVAQLHTHPAADVRMSDLDRQWEVVTHGGALSIIVPSYGTHGLVGFPGVNVYEREGQTWRLWSSDETSRRLRIMP